MKVYRTDEIRNVVLLGHGGSGKTSLVEAMLYVSGASNRMGKVSDASTVSDFDKEEQKRGFSISTSLIPIEWEKAKINILESRKRSAQRTRRSSSYPARRACRSARRKHGSSVINTISREWSM